MKTKATGVPMSYRLAVTSRILASLFGGYLVASLVSLCVSWGLPMVRLQAVITGMMVSFVVWLLVVIWCFACSSALRAWLGVGLCALLSGGLAAALHGVAHP
ncbi:DUF3649 domain-containing protein [Pseudomonas sp. KNUC1026]|uniref:DUF3649 domain-containing protein n=1 Tax=Pseudomonas sp. KNUC1026 TaxID=2893890 RepID=UPI001F46E30D|nr:DUF3649 domain-containing protein [Pseudomonas sp. KNUC1026]UFH48616.1 DUF3649 domain-containing protein [Pseudomonas sp. KNUC1026]